MPRDSNGAYSLPSGLTAITGEDILPEQINTPFADIATALTGSLPRNGTGAMLAALPMGGYKITDVADGTADTDGVSKGQMDAAISAAIVAPGIVTPYAGASAPSGWLLCNGQAVSRTTYASLFAIISTTYGTGDGSTTFNVPDLRGEFVRGLDGGRGVDSGRVLGSSQGAAFAEHTHTATTDVTDAGHTHSIVTQTGPWASGGGSLEAISFSAFGSANSHNTDSATTDITVDVTLSNEGGTETRPRNVALNYIIKA